MEKETAWRMDGKVCLITGGNAGIGKRAAQQLSEIGAEVIIVCRNSQSGEAAAIEIRKSTGNNVHVLAGDLSSQASIHALAETVKRDFSRLDVLIHNAANFDLSMKAPVLTEDDVETIFATNHLGPFLLTNLLFDRLKQSKGRVITIASKGLLAYPGLYIDCDNLNGEKSYSPAKAYYQSKLAQLMFTYYAAELFHDTGVTFNAIRVPSVKVDKGRHTDVSFAMRQAYRLKRRFAIMPEKMAEVYTFLAADPGLATVNGKYFDEKRKMVTSSKKSYNKEAWKKLWETSNQLTHIENW